ncbi:hypothetical protein ERJ75_000369100 [Trypanosoma vivax]|nr:hypothetical protein ERJ75_000369100 [Trypanosoma vivax]
MGGTPAAGARRMEWKRTSPPQAGVQRCTRTARARAANAGAREGTRRTGRWWQACAKGTQERRGRDSQRRKVWDERKGREWQGAERAVRSEERTGGRRVLQPGLWERMRRRSGGNGAGNKELRQRRGVGSTLREAGEATGLRRPLRCPSVAPRT